MDARHFDALARTVTEMGTRRGLLALLATLPLIGGFVALLDPDEAAARKNRRKTRKKPHKRAKRRRKKRKKSNKKQKCKAKSRARICANRCGIVKNKQSCKQRVDCGSCDCGGSCPICQTCNARTGVCEPDPQQQGDECGEPGQVCLADGTCACNETSCAPCEACQGDGTCSLPCGGAGCCDNGNCASGEEHDACGRNGEACVACTGPGSTCGGGGQEGVCGCTPTTCSAEGKDCGTFDIGCGETEDCGECPFPNQPCENNVCGTCAPDCDGKPCGTDTDGCGGPCLDGSCPGQDDTCGGGGTPGVCGCTPTTCQAEGKNCGSIEDRCGGTLNCGGCSGFDTCGGGGTPNVCGCTPDGTCPAGANCGSVDDGCGGRVSCGGESCGGATPICVDNVCTACSSEHRCETGCCSGGTCVASCPSCHTCVNGVCEPCPVCCNGTCCDGCCDSSNTCGPCLVFITSTTHNGNLGGLAGADAICQNLAENDDKPLPGTYKAWLSAGAGPGDSPANGRFHRSARPYRLVDGTTVADNWAGLTSGSLKAAISRDELGAEVGPPPPYHYVWTNTTPQGFQSSQERSCNGWMSAGDHLGRLGRSDIYASENWTQGWGDDCSLGNPHLYCFQQE